MGSQSDEDAAGFESIGSETTSSEESQEYPFRDRLKAYARILDLPHSCLPIIAGVAEPAPPATNEPEEEEETEQIEEGGLDSATNPEEDVEGAASHESPEQADENEDQEDHEEGFEESDTLSEFSTDDLEFSDKKGTSSSAS